MDCKPAFEPKRSDIIRKFQSEVDGIFVLASTENHAAHVDDVGEYLEDLPSSLKDVYYKIFNRLQPASEDRKTRIWTALQFLAASAVSVTLIGLHTTLKISRSMKDAPKGGLEKL